MILRNLKFLLAPVLTAALAGCGLPAAAPTASKIETRHDPEGEFYLVRVNARALPFLATAKTQSFPSGFSRFGYSPSVTLRPGDVVDVTIFEAGGSSLFGGGTAVPGQVPSARTPLPSQIVEKSGRILVPFAGSVEVAGKTPSQAAGIIEQALSSQTVRPQVIVSLAANNTSTASIGGDVNRAGPYPLTLRGERLLDAIAFAGGGRYPISETDIRVIRGKQGATVPLQQVVDHPGQNIVVRPNDQIVAVRNPKTFTVLGASAKVAQYNFDTPQVTLAEAVARAGGPVDTYGDPGGVFLFRREPTAVARNILATVDTTDIVGNPVKAHPLVGPTTPILYRVDMNTSDGYFLAQKIQISDQDVILIADAEGAQLVKLLTLVRGATGIFYDIGRSAAN